MANGEETKKLLKNYSNRIHRVSSNAKFKSGKKRENALTLVTFLNVGQLQTGPAAQAGAALIAFAGVRRVAVVPDEDRNFDVQLLPLDHIGHRRAVWKLQIAAEYDGLVDVRRYSLRTAVRILDHSRFVEDLLSAIAWLRGGFTWTEKREAD